MDLNALNFLVLLNALLSVGILALGLRPKVFRQRRDWGALDERGQGRPAERRWCTERPTRASLPGRCQTSAGQEAPPP